MIWFEGYAVGCEGKDSPHQLMLQKENIKANASLIRSMNEIAAKRFGIEHVPYKVLQITHSGRKTVDNQMQPYPITGSYNPFFDCTQQGELVLASDEYIEEQIERYIETAENALEAGFDGIDIKLAHGYFLSTLMNAFLRDGPYGGCFENRIRAIVSITDGIRKRCGDALHLCYRINAYDAVPYPHGWGMVKKCGMMRPDLSEPIQLLKILAEKGLKIANISCSDSRFSPYHEGLYAKTKEIVPNQYQGEHALLDATRRMRQAVPSIRYVGTGMAWFEQFGANVAAGCMDEGWFDVAGFGRQALIDPAFAQKLLHGARPTAKQVCCLCDCCHRLSMQGYTQAGCIHEPTGYYARLYRDNVLRNEEQK